MIAKSTGEGGGVVPGIVVVHVDACVRQGGAEGSDDVADRRSLVVSRDQDCDIDVADGGRELLTNSVESSFSSGKTLENVGR